jgi:hypothetical protein
MTKTTVRSAEMIFFSGTDGGLAGMVITPRDDTIIHLMYD